MPISKPDFNLIFASQAPSQDLPAAFNNYARGWDEARKNNGKPTIKQFNYLIQQLDLKALWMIQNGAALPFDETVDYAEGSVVVKDDELKQWKDGVWKSITADTSHLQSEIDAINDALLLKADKTYVDSQDSALQSQIDQKATVAYLDAALDEQTQTVNTALSQLSTQAGKFYPTLAEANADIANIEVNQPVQVGESGANGGLYYKASVGATSLTKSAYDPLTQAKSYADTAVINRNVKDVTYTEFSVGISLNTDPMIFATETQGAPTNAKSLIIPCYPDTQYEVIKSHNTDRFRIAEFSNIPSGGSAIDFFTKKSDTSDLTFSFRTQKTTKYFVVYITSGDALPSDFSITVKRKIISDVDTVKAESVSVKSIKVNDGVYLDGAEFDLSNRVNAFLSGINSYLLAELATEEEKEGVTQFSSIIIPVDSGKKYSLIRNQITNRFRVMGFANPPVHGSRADQIINLDNNLDSFEFQAGDNIRYIVVYLCREAVLDLEFSLKILDKLDLTTMLDARIVKGKNLFNPEVAYLSDNLALPGEEGVYKPILDVKVNDNNPESYAKTAVVQVKPNTTYTIQKSVSNRFRVGFSDVYPAVGTSVYMVKGFSNDLNQVVTVTTGSNTNYLVLTLSKNEFAPSFVQVEEGEVATSKETFGYKISPLAEAMNVSFAGFVNAGVGDGVIDDTDALKIDILMNSGIISFDPNKTYLISDTLEINIARYHRLNGNGARFVSASPDKPCFRLKGSMAGGHSASPSTNNSYARQQYGFVFDHTIIYGQTVGVGIGVEVTGCLAPTLTNNNIFFLDKGVVFKNTNRDVNLIGNRIWVNKTYGIEFHDSANIHQINIVSNIITYNTVNIIIDNADIYNIQITGNDIETASSGFLNTSGGANIIINAQTGLTEDVTIVGNTLEDHWVTDGMIVLNGANTNSIASVCIDGNSFGNSNDVEIKMGGCSGVYVGGQFKHSYGATVEATGSIDGLTMNVQSKKTGTKGGLFKCVNASADLSNVTISGCNLSGTSRRAIDIVANKLTNFIINGNGLKDLGQQQASIKIAVDTVEGLRVDMNNISENTYSKAIEITANTVLGKNSMLFNSAKTGVFEAPEQFNTQGNW